eukprot:TRINITY_DN3217_c0_g1_i1.p1 TRINITY_DN3217_c0_g1~~TRINITY_DN3217_c0_g1_i1.p1  ORF type:complete len:101 (+),score=9.47 TRINITY_DN3217_c0_g1_i1:151-453(+)
MSELFDNYEQEYCEISAEISRQLTQLRAQKSGGETRKILMQKIEKSFSEAEEDLRHMEIEAHSVQANKREQLKLRLNNYKKDLEGSRREFRTETAKAHRG